MLHSRFLFLLVSVLLLSVPFVFLIILLLKLFSLFDDRRARACSATHLRKRDETKLSNNVCDDTGALNPCEFLSGVCPLSASHRCFLPNLWFSCASSSILSHILLRDKSSLGHGKATKCEPPLPSTPSIYKYRTLSPADPPSYFVCICDIYTSPTLHPPVDRALGPVITGQHPPNKNLNDHSTITSSHYCRPPPGTAGSSPPRPSPGQPGPAAATTAQQPFLPLPPPPSPPVSSTTQK